MVISQLIRCLWPPAWRSGHRTQGKRGKRKRNEGKRQNAGGYTHLSVAEREAIHQLHAQGASMGQIAKHLGRSSRTVHLELQRDPPGPPTLEGANEVELSPEQGSGMSRRTFGERLLEHIEPVLAERADAVFDANPGLVELMVYKELGVRPPTTTTEDKLIEQILENPDMKSRLLRHKLDEMLRGGVSEFEVVSRWIPVLMMFAEQMNSGQASRALLELVRRGEVPATIAELVKLMRPVPTTTTLPASPPPTTPQSPQTSQQPKIAARPAPPPASPPRSAPAVSTAPNAPRLPRTSADDLPRLV